MNQLVGVNLCQTRR